METEDVLVQKLLFLALCTLVAANLIVFSIKVSQHAFFDSPKRVLRQDVTNLRREVSSSTHAITQSTGRAIRLASAITNVNAFIKPAGSAQLPVITPVATVAVTQIPSTSPVPPTVQPVVTAPVTNQLASASTPVNDIDAYAWGNCTWWASKRRAQIGDPIPNSWGNAATWALGAAGSGYVVDHHPSPGAIMQLTNTAGGLGHVAFVESVDQDGTWHISEMNVLGLNMVDHKSEPPFAATHYNFIHDKP